MSKNRRSTRDLIDRQKTTIGGHHHGLDTQASEDCLKPLLERQQMKDAKERRRKELELEERYRQLVADEKKRCELSPTAQGQFEF